MAQDKRALSEKPERVEVEVKNAAPTEQEIRDRHYKENGVKADLSGGVPPESEEK